MSRSIIDIPEGPQKQRSGLDPIVGIAMVVAGVVLLSDKLNIPNLLKLMEYWPVFLIFGGVAVLLESQQGRLRG